MIQILQGIGKIFITLSLAISSLFGINSTAPTTPNVGATIPISVAVFQSSLQSSITSSATSMTLVTGTDKAGSSLSGYLCFNIDEGTSTEEFVCGTTAGTAVSSMIRGISPVDGDLEVTALKKAHRRGATVKITNYPSLAIVSRILNGVETIPNKISYNSHPTFSADTELVDKKYVDDTNNSGAADASTTVKGLSEEATQAEINAGTDAGGTSARLFVNPSTLATSNYGNFLPSTGQKDALAGTSGTPGSSNKYVTNDDTGLTGASKLLRLTAGGKITTSTIDTGTTAGQIIISDTGNKLPVIDGSQLTNVVSYKNGDTIKDASDASTTQNIAHGLGRVPKKIKIYAQSFGGTGSLATFLSQTTYNGTTQSSISTYASGAQVTALNTFTLNTSSTASDTQTGVVTWDATNIIITWTKTGSPTGSYKLLWEAE